MASTPGGSAKRTGDPIVPENSKRVRSDYSTAITVLVGANKQPFIVHQDLVCARSDFFKAAVANDWKESESKIVELPEQEPSLFKIYLESIYAPTVDLCEVAQGHAEVALQATDEDRGLKVECRVGHILVKLWIIGDYLSDLWFKNESMKALGSKRGAARIARPAFELAFKSTTPGSGLYNCCVGSLIKGITSGRAQWIEEKLPAHCAAAVLKELVRKGEVGEDAGEDALDKCLERKKQ